jgi:hypothetical protein
MLHCAKCIGQFLGGGTGAKGFLLAVSRGPAGEADHFKGSGDAAICCGVGICIKLGRPRQHRPTGRAAQSGGKSVGFTHGPQITHEVHGIAVGNGPGKAVSYWQGEASALEEGTEITDFTHGQDAG